jgi:hypothetical protein
MRYILKHTASIFDPIGLISPFIVQARLIVQDCFQAKLGWDDPVPEALRERWKLFTDEVANLSLFTLPRCLQPRPARNSIHVFCDASVKAYAAAAYFVAETDDATTSTLIMSKTKVAPLSKTTIPRLELLGAVEATKIATTISSTLGIGSDRVYFWTDNQCVLAWIRTRTKSLKTYVANRIELIQERSIMDNWRYVPTDVNPADIASRGSTITELSSSSLWKSGPDFILRPQEEWPEQPPYFLPGEAQEEMKTEKADNEQFNVREVTTQTEPWPWEAVIERNFRSMNKFITAVALCRRYLHILQDIAKGRRKRPVLLTRTRTTIEKKIGQTKGRNRVLRFDPPVRIETPSMEERRQAETAIYAAIQGLHLRQIITDLRRNGKVNHTHPLAKFQPELDSDGVVRQASRLRYNTDIKTEIRFPVIIPAQSRLVDLIIHDVHEDLNHSKSVNHIFNQMSKYRLTKGTRERIKKYVKNCLRCKRLWPRPLGQQMGPLPDFRVPTGGLEPFSTTTLDAAGPFEIRQGRGKARLKRHLLIFTCAVTRAVHIEVMFGVHTDDFLMALSRFCNERSKPKLIVCDNAGQFTKGAKMLADFGDEDLDRIQARHPDIKFQFIPARTPHVNGVTERMVQSMKKSLKHIITDGLLTEDQFFTAAKKAQGILNSRPLGYQSTDSEDLAPLTPAHFLADKALQDIHVDDRHMDLRSKYHLVQRVMRDAWKRFQQEVIPKLNVVNKWIKQQDNFEVGDVVVIMDAEESGQFPLGIITKTFPGSDGLVRTVQVKLRGHETKRHASRLMLLLREPRREAV